MNMKLEVIDGQGLGDGRPKLSRKDLREIKGKQREILYSGSKLTSQVFFETHESIQSWARNKIYTCAYKCAPLLISELDRVSKDSSDRLFGLNDHALNCSALFVTFPLGTGPEEMKAYLEEREYRLTPGRDLFGKFPAGYETRSGILLFARDLEEALEMEIPLLNDNPPYVQTHVDCGCAQVLKGISHSYDFNRIDYRNRHIEDIKRPQASYFSKYLRYLLDE